MNNFVLSLYHRFNSSYYKECCLNLSYRTVDQGPFILVRGMFNVYVSCAHIMLKIITVFEPHQKVYLLHYIIYMQDSLLQE